MMASNAATLDNLLAELLAKRSVLQGWDAALNLPEASVNKFVQSQWAAQTSDGKQQGTVVWCEGVQDVRGGPLATVTQFEFALGAPLIQLQGGKNCLTIRQNLLSAQVKAGTVKVDGSFNAAECRFNANDPNVAWSAPEKAAVSEDSHIGGTVPLSVVQGMVSADAYSVVLDYSAGSFNLHGLADGNVNQAGFIDQLQRWFTGNKLRFVVASVDFSDHANLAALQPTSLKVNVMQTIGGNNILQLLIATKGGQPNSTSIDVTEPVPMGNGSMYSLMISSKVLFQDIIVDGYNRGSGLVKLVAVAPDSPDEAWYAQTRNPMQYQGTIGFGGVFPEIKKQAEGGMNFGGSLADGLAVSTYTSPGANINLQLDLSANYPLKLSGEGQNQQIQMTAGPVSVRATGVAENAVKPQLESFLNNDIKNDMTAISFAPVSNFALKNLVLPGHFPKMGQAHIPGDLLIVGTFEEDPR